MSEASTARLRTLPHMRLTRVSEQAGPDCLPVAHQVDGKEVKYWRQLQGDRSGRKKAYPKFPIVLNQDGSPWEEACLWLLDRAQARPRSLSSLPSIAQGLRDYKVYLDDFGYAWDDFSSVDKYTRPTYLYKAYLQDLVKAGDIASSTASRRMSTVVGLYRFLSSDSKMRFEPANDPWEERRLSFEYRDGVGLKRSKTVITTDLAIHVPAREYAWDKTIDDGGKLRPLPISEQRALIKALKTLGNREYELMHYVSLLTGPRVQTVLTLRWGYFSDPPNRITQWPYKLRCGPGTCIDTKRDVSNVYLAIPRPLYEMLHVYVMSDRAKQRRGKSLQGDDPLNYMFLTNQGSPYYESKDDRNSVNLQEEDLRRSSPIGQNLREFIGERVIPEVQRVIPKFHYRFHDMRATFGLNWTDSVCAGPNGEKKRMWAREQLRKLMWHKDATVTDRYLTYRDHLQALEEAQEGWNQDLIDLIQSAS